MDGLPPHPDTSTLTHPFGEAEYAGENLIRFDHIFKQDTEDEGTRIRGYENTRVRKYEGWAPAARIGVWGCRGVGCRGIDVGFYLDTHTPIRLSRMSLSGFYRSRFLARIFRIRTWAIGFYRSRTHSTGFTDPQKQDTAKRGFADRFKRFIRRFTFRKQGYCAEEREALQRKDNIPVKDGITSVQYPFEKRWRSLSLARSSFKTVKDRKTSLTRRELKGDGCRFPGGQKDHLASSLKPMTPGPTAEPSLVRERRYSKPDYSYPLLFPFP